VISVGSDALNADEQKRVLGTDASGLYYPAVLRLERQNIKLITKKVPLQAGMSLTADIKLRERKFINILLKFVENSAPFLPAFLESAFLNTCPSPQRLCTGFRWFAACAIFRKMATLGTPMPTRFASLVTNRALNLT
jgi:hypothetical protein